MRAIADLNFSMPKLRFSNINVNFGNINVNSGNINVNSATLKLPDEPSIYWESPTYAFHGI